MVHVTLSPAILWTKVGDVLQHSNSMVASCLLHLTDLLPGVVLVVPQDVLQINSSVIIPSSWKYIVIIKIIRYREMFNINIIENVLTKYEDVILD